MLRLCQRNVAIGLKRFARLLRETDEGSVQRTQDQRGHCDAIEHAGRRRAIVVIARILETTIARYDLVIEVAQRANGSKIDCRIYIREKRGVGFVAPQKPPQEMPLIKTIARRVQSIRTD